ncbi:MAG: serine hydrolase [Desulfocapsaceae bacterium]|nr:serine hydrolase [Desulfocapsaceae bacterium]
MIKTRSYLSIGLLLCVLLPIGTAWGQTSLNPILKPYLGEFNLPALAAAVVKNGEIVSSGAVGVREFGSNIPVTINDPFHIGSDTKAMTALLAAIMVEEGKMRWDSTIAEIFPEIADKTDSKVRGVTLEQLLSHTSGIPSDNEDFSNLLIASYGQEGNLDELRYWLVEQWCKLPLASEPGTKFAYSNMGYTIAGAMIERVSHTTWDELIVQRIFTPLDLKTAGLGCQSSLGKIDAPLGHLIINGKVEYRLAGPNGDNPAIIGPAGIAHMSVLDFASWAGWNAGNGSRKPFIVRSETMAKLHTPIITLPNQKGAPPGTPPRGKYALGWGELSVDWAPYPLMYHGGSNGLNLAHIWLDKNRDIAIVIVTNIGGEKSEEGLRKLAAQLYGEISKTSEEHK